MLKLKVGDRVEITDWSYAFGIKDGKFNEHFYSHPAGGKPLIVVKVDLKVTGNANQRMSSGKLVITDLLITDNDGNFWFVTSFLTERISHTVTFDGGEVIEISDESFEALKRTLSKS